MKRYLKRLSCLWLGFLLAIFQAFSVFAEEDGEDASSEPESPVSVSLFLEDGASQKYLIPPLNLQCPQGTSPEGLLDLLKKYAYISGYRLEGGALLEVEMTENGVSSLYGSAGEWQLLVNGTLLDAGDFPALADGDQICWRYRSEYIEASSEPSRRTASSTVSTVWNGDYSLRLAQAASWLKSNQTLPATLTSLGAAGVSVDYRKIAALKDQIHDQGSAYPTAALAASDVLAASFCGIPAGNAGGENLLAAVYDYPDISKGGSLSPAFALLALDCNSYPLPAGSINTRDTLCTVLCSYQNEDGGFAPAKGEGSAPGYTAFAITALSAYPESSALRDAVSQGLLYLSAVQLEDGSYAGGGDFSSALATEAVIIALCATATPLDSPDFLRQASVLDALLAFQTESGGFAPEIGSPAEEEATAGGVLALAAAKNARNIFLLQTPISGEPAQPSSPPEESGTASLGPGGEGEKDVPAAAESKKAILFGSLGLTIGASLGCVALLAVILFYRRKIRRHIRSEEPSVKDTE